MFNINKVFITKDYILNCCKDVDLLAYYLNVTTVPTVINSPFRKDNKPSFGLFYDFNGILHFKDFATNETGDIFKLLQQYFNKNFQETLFIIYKDLSKINVNSYINSFSRKERTKKNNNTITTLDCKVRQWKDYDFKYWNSYGITIKGLSFGDVFPISHVIITTKNTVYTIPADKYAYVYIEHKDHKTTKKIYQPYNTQYKWLNSHDSSVWDLWNKLPKTGDNLIITSSRKDALCIWENTGIPSTCVQAESYLPKEKVLNILKNRFKNIFILYDNDFTKETNYGLIYGKILSDKFKIPQIIIPEHLASKDPSDLYKNHGSEVFKQTIYNLIKYSIINNTIKNERK